MATWTARLCEHRESPMPTSREFNVRIVYRETRRSLLVGYCYLRTSNKAASRHTHAQNLVIAGIRKVRHLEIRPDAAGLTGHHLVYRMLTARAARSATVAKEISDCAIIITLAHRDRTGESVGENAVLVLNARNK
jgi:hypothetical protein